MLSPDSLLSLREILRVRRELPALEVTQLLQGLPETLDKDDEGSGGALINEVVVNFQEPPQGGIAEMAKRSIRSWPPFRLHVEGEEEQDAGATIVGGVSLFATSPSARLAALIYELLGGRIRNEELRRNYSPLAQLDEPANLLLKKALSRRGFSDCASFWSEWMETVAPGVTFTGPAPAPVAEREEEPVPTLQPQPTPGPIRVSTPPTREELRAGENLSIPEELLQAGEPGDVLELTPVDKPAVPTRLVARPVFKIGRSRRLSDLPTRSVSDTGSGESIKELSRVHVQAERTESGFGFRDGNGEKPSANGSTWNQLPLSHEKITPITFPGMLLLSPTSCKFRIDVLPFPSNKAARLDIANMADWKGAEAMAALPTGRHGALVFRHPRGAMVVRQSLWLLSAVGVEVLSTGELVWNEEGNASHAILHRKGHFWLANMAATMPVKVHGIALGIGEAAPISAGVAIEMGGVEFRAAVS